MSTAELTESRWMIGTCYLEATGQVDLEAGIIRGCAVCTEGEAKGHGVNLDSDFIKDVVSYGKEKGKLGLKARFGHPSMSSTALGTFLGRFKNFSIDRSGGASVARADLFLSKSAKVTPEGDLFKYTTELASDDPKAFGTSIVFKPGEKYVIREGKKVVIEYRSIGFSLVPFADDKEVQKDEKIFVECKGLNACDFVDDPAANPDGLFSSGWSGVTWAGQVSDFLDTHPHIFELVEKSPEVLQGFVIRYREFLNRKGSQMDPELEEVADATEAVDTDKPAADATGDEVSEDATPPAEDAGGETDQANTDEPEASDDDQDDDTEPGADDVDTDEDTKEVDPPTDTPQKASAKKTGKDFLAAFGDKGGVWFAEGLTFEQASAQYVKQLEADNKRLQAAVDTLGGEEPVSFDDEPEKPTGNYIQQATQLAKDEGLTMTQACSRLAMSDPELYRDYKETRK